MSGECIVTLSYLGISLMFQLCLFVIRDFRHFQILNYMKYYILFKVYYIFIIPIENDKKGCILIIQIIIHLKNSKMLKYLNTKKPSCLSLLLIIGLFGLACRQQKISNDIQYPRRSQHKLQMNGFVSQRNKISGFRFPQINYETSFQWFIHNDTIQQQFAFDRSLYSNNITQYCLFYPTSITTSNKNRIQYQTDVQPLKYFLYDRLDPSGDAKNTQSHLFMLGTNSYLYQYLVTQKQISFLGNYSVPYQISLIQNQQLTINIEIEVISGNVFLINKNGMYLLDQIIGTFYKVQGHQISKDRVVDVSIFRQSPQKTLNGTKIWVCSDSDIKIYEFFQINNKVTVRKVMEKIQITPQPILAIYYDKINQYFYATTSSRLLIHHFASTHTNVTFYELEGNCKSVNKIKQALFLSCQYEHVNYIGQYRVQKEKVVLNRFYDENIVEGLRMVQTLGYDKMLIIGDEQAIIIGQAINRRQLEQLYSNGQTEQLGLYIYAFDMIELLFLPQFSSSSKSVSLSIGSSGMQIYVINYDSPQLDCNFGADVADTLSLLVVFNTSHCPYARDDPSTVSPNYLYCQTFYPLKVELNVREYEQKTSKFIFFIIMLIFFVVFLVCAGCGVKIRNKYNSFIQAAKNRIDKIRRSRQNSQMKKL